MTNSSNFTFCHKTPLNELYIQSFIEELDVNLVNADYSKCSKDCLYGCKNYNMKYSCPPHSPSFNNFKLSYSSIVINCLRINKFCLKQEYNSIRISNVVLKSIQKKAYNSIFRELSNKRFHYKILENGSCRLCKRCKLQENVPCIYPNKMRPSLEATGVDVNDLIKKAFGFELKWYKKGGFPDYQCVVGGILTNEPEKIINELSNYYRINYCAKKDIEDIDMSMVFETNKQLKVPSLIV